jgi:hypothetical protein
VSEWQRSFNLKIKTAQFNWIKIKIINKILFNFWLPASFKFILLFSLSRFFHHNGIPNFKMES